MRRGLPIALGLLVAAGGSAQAPVSDRTRLVAAKREAAAAARRAAALAAAAAGERDAARRAAAEERALGERVRSAAAELEAARARAAILGRMVAAQRATLARIEAPAVRLTGGLAALARRPAIAGLAQPGSIDDLVHVRAVLGGALPVVAARTAGVRAEVVRARALAADATLAAQALRQGRVRLEGERTRLAELEARHRASAATLGRGAMSEEDRALALGERARDLVERLEAQGSEASTAVSLAALPDPLPRPLGDGAVLPAPPRGVYRLPVWGRVVTGEGEISDNGVRARGVTLAVAPGAMVVAPAAGRVRYARRFRGYGAVVILDHGSGWTSTLTGLDRVAVRTGQMVAAGAPLGAAAGGEEPRVTVELRRGGRPVDLAQLVG